MPWSNRTQFVVETRRPRSFPEAENELEIVPPEPPANVDEGASARMTPEVHQTAMKSQGPMTMAKNSVANLLRFAVNVLAAEKPPITLSCGTIFQHLEALL
jgi:hypothetical protein